MAELLSALGDVLSIQMLWWIFLGFTLGAIGGAIPGIGAELGIVLLIPFTMEMGAATALVFLVASYSGSQYAGTIPGILLNAPGSASSAAATLDGYPMAKQGQAVTAISISGASSAFGNLFGGLAVLAMFPLLSQLVLLLGTPEFFMMAVLGLCTIAVASDRGVLRGLIVASLGALLATVGSSALVLDRRYTFGVAELYGGISLIPAFVGLFALAEMIKLAQQQSLIDPDAALDGRAGSRMEGIRLTLVEWRTMIKASFIGLFVGILPGQGGVVANFLAYVEAKRSSSDPLRFGRGHPAGIVASDASNNAVVAGSLVPTLSFGIPGGAAAAVVLGAMMLHGLRPGPTMFDQSISVTYALILSLIVCAVFILAIGSGMANVFGKAPNVPLGILVPVVVVVSLMGTMSIGNNFFHVWQALLFGIIGFFLLRYKFPIVPFILGFILGPIAELNLYRSLLISGGDLTIFLRRPVSAVLVVASVGILFWPGIQKLRHAEKRADTAGRQIEAQQAGIE